MSKKKSFSGNTMTLKDFHGGSIPSDLPLPSAPGVNARAVDRPGYDRQTSWGNATGRSEHRLRPSSSGSMRNLDDKTPFLTNTAHIGRNFDEDERKPLDGAMGPRRTVTDETPAPLRLEPKGGVGRFSDHQNSSPQVGAVSVNSYSARVVEGGHSGLSSRTSGGNGGGSHPNAWGMRKEAVTVAETVSAPWTVQSTVSKFAQASALDQISSGRWQTKPTHHQAADVEVIRQAELPDSLYVAETESYSGVKFPRERESYETMLVRHAEKSFTVEEGIRGGVKEIPGVERIHSPVLLDGKERSSVLYTNEGQTVNPDGKCVGSESRMPLEAYERPKLKLLPRTKPLDTPESSGDHKLGFQQPIDTNHQETGGHLIGNASHVKPGISSNEASHVKPRPGSSEAGNGLVERPKLNLKPRSQLLDETEGSKERERKALFGGARPREMVLKERGIDDVVNNHDELQSPGRRIRSDVPRPEILPAHANTLHHGERVENIPNDHRITGRGHEKREQRADVQKADIQRKNNWQNDNWRMSKDSEKPHVQERQPSPETWRKPVIEQPKPGNSNPSGLRYGKAASALELAQAFSKPVSDPKSVDQFSGQRGLPSRTHLPFSRLTGPSTRPQINGY